MPQRGTFALDVNNLLCVELLLYASFFSIFYLWSLFYKHPLSMFGPGGKHGVVGDVADVRDVRDIGENLGDVGENLGENLGDVGEDLGVIGENLGDVITTRNSI